MSKDIVNKVLVCVDEKQHSRMAMKFACRLAKKRKQPFVMLHVIDPADYNTFSSVADTIRQERLEAGEALMADLRDSFKDEYKQTPECAIREGRIGEEIMRFIEDDHEINMLIVGAAIDGSSAKSGIINAITSEVGDRLQIPVMIVPGTLTDLQIDALT